MDVTNPPQFERQLRQLISCLDALSQRIMMKQPAASSELELSRNEVKVLMVIGDKGAAIMRDLAGVLNGALSTATNTVDKLVAKGLVERMRVDDDRRIVQVGLSDKGRGLHEAFLESKLEMGRGMLQALSPGEREIFLELMVKMTQPSLGAAEIADRATQAAG
jgi:DNA-binding MarR family transcriptional regulator